MVSLPRRFRLPPLSRSYPSAPLRQAQPAEAQTFGTPPIKPLTHIRESVHPSFSFPSNFSFGSTRLTTVWPRVSLSTVNKRTLSSRSGRPSNTAGLCEVSRTCLPALDFRTQLQNAEDNRMARRGFKAWSTLSIAKSRGDLG